ncbi:SMODS domain-containing nucleotidyltransferase [Agathobacter rectalis]|jgi:predicted nucleotidyltransferase|uniref:Nucleotidyltransferase n=1 Tax=Agathobacter rectalis TaxID=39491 RepID=A0A396FDB8_9FIRM|nr:nucleotidyltransferase [Agathobacter rectalis]RGZ75188.1 nucleotidyltransferase [Agathobacter rectalis]RHL77211.1 nucleotidyltransferase [Agathobacter rectalis]
MAQKMTTYFNDFLKNIRLTENQVNELKSAHTTLRTRLAADEDLKDIIVTTFLQGSYRRATAVKPKMGKRSDVDIVVVTKLDKETVTPEEALDIFEPFLKKYYDGKYRKQGRSWGIEMTHVDLDVVPTSAPSLAEQGLLENMAVLSDDDLEEMNDKAEKLEKSYSSNLWNLAFTELTNADENADWKNEPLFIPDREAEFWDKTHPLEQIRWTQEKNAKCNKHYVNVVKCIKWWRKEKYPDVKHPKSYPLEHFVGDCCPDDIDSVAEGIVLTLEKIVSDYPTKPVLEDRGVSEHDVFGRLSDEDYEAFYNDVCGAAITARNAYEAETVAQSASLWRELFGNKFPEAKSKEAVFTKRESASTNLSGGRFA